MTAFLGVLMYVQNVGTLYSYSFLNNHQCCLSISQRPERRPVTNGYETNSFAFATAGQLVDGSSKYMMYVLHPSLDFPGH